MTPDPPPLPADRIVSYAIAAATDPSARFPMPCLPAAAYLGPWGIPQATWFLTIGSPVHIGALPGRTARGSNFPRRPTVARRTRSAYLIFNRPRSGLSASAFLLHSYLTRY